MKVFKERYEKHYDPTKEALEKRVNKEVEKDKIKELVFKGAEGLMALGALRGYAKTAKVKGSFLEKEKVSSEVIFEEADKAIETLSGVIKNSFEKECNLDESKSMGFFGAIIGRVIQIQTSELGQDFHSGVAGYRGVGIKSARPYLGLQK